MQQLNNWWAQKTTVGFIHHKNNVYWNHRTKEIKLILTDSEKNVFSLQNRLLEGKYFTTGGFVAMTRWMLTFDSHKFLMLGYPNMKWWSECETRSRLMFICSCSFQVNSGKQGSDTSITLGLRCTDRDPSSLTPNSLRGKQLGGTFVSESPCLRALVPLQSTCVNRNKPN